MSDSHGANTMMTERLSCGSGLPPGVIFQNSDQGLPVVEPTDYRVTEVQLRSALAQSEARIRQQDELIQRQDLLSKESIIG